MQRCFPRSFCVSCLGGNMTMQTSVLLQSHFRSPAAQPLLAWAWPQTGTLGTVTQHSLPSQQGCCGQHSAVAPGWALLHAQPTPCLGAKASRDAASKGEAKKSWEQVTLASPGSISKINLCRDKSPEIFIWRISCFSVNPIVNPTEMTGFFLLPFSPWLSLSTYIKING